MVHIKCEVGLKPVIYKADPRCRPDRGTEYELSQIYSYLKMQSQQLIIILLQRIN